MKLRDSLYSKVRSLAKLDKYYVIKRLDNFFADESLGTKYEPRAWYYDKRKVEEHVAKNRPWRSGLGFFSQDWEALATFRIKLLLNYPTFQFIFMSLLAVLWVSVIATALILLA